MFEDEPGMAASIAPLAPFASPVRARTKARVRAPAASPRAISGDSSESASAFCAGNGQAEREAATRLVPVAPGQGSAIIRLRLRMLADEIVGEAAVARRSSPAWRRAVSRGRNIGEPRRRRPRSPSAAPMPACGSGLCGPGLFGPTEESGGCLAVAESKRSAPGANQSVETIGAGGEHLHVARECVGRSFASSADRNLRVRNCRNTCKDRTHHCQNHRRHAYAAEFHPLPCKPPWQN